jgi:hypothetical protein
MDREIAVTLQPRFVATFLEELENGDDEAFIHEWRQMAVTLENGSTIA